MIDVIFRAVSSAFPLASMESEGICKSDFFMMKINNYYWPLGALAFYLVSGGLTARTFTDVKGRKIKASIVKVLDDRVVLKLDKKKKDYTVPFEKLSVEDNAYIKQWQEDQKKEELAVEKKPKVRARRGSAAALKAEYHLEDNFDKPWPNRIDSGHNVEISSSTDHDSEKRFVYLSPNYEFISDVELSKNVVKKFAAMFEATREYCRELPISTMKAHVPGEKFRNKILLFETKDSYVRNGGPPSSAGVFIGGKGVVMVPLVSLGVKKVGSGYMFDYKGSNKTLPHELTHQVTDSEYFASGARGWFSEGLAEYVATTPYRSGKFMVRSNLSAIKAYATGFSKDGRGRNIGEDISAPDLKEYMLQPYGSFTGNGNFNYALGLLITYYYFHWDGEGDRANINAFLKALKDGKRGEEALNMLLNGRSWDEMEKAISKSWRTRGVKIEFR